MSSSLDTYIPDTHVIQVTNVAPAATLEQMKNLFGFMGRIRNIKLYPSETYIIEPQSRVCYVEYYENWSVGVAQYLTNTVFIDRALIVVPIPDDGIPCESTALALTNPSSALPGLVSSGPNALINEISGVDGNLVITTIDPKLTALGLPQYPPLPAQLDPAKIEEIRRTVVVGNLDPSGSAENLLKFMNQIGEVKFLKMVGDSLQASKSALVEFTDQSSLPKALQYNGVAFDGRPLIITHSTNAIVKPLPKNTETAQKEIDEAMKRVREAQSLISAVIEPELSEKEKKRSRRSHSRSRSRRRSSSRSRRKRSRSHSKQSRSHSKRSRSRSKRSVSRSKRSRSRRRSRGRRASRSPPRQSKHKSRSRSRERKKISPLRKKGKSRSRSRDRSKKNRRSNSRSPSKHSSKSRSEKLRGSKEKVESTERERTPKSEKYEKNNSTKASSKSDRSTSRKENSQSRELYGPSLLEPEASSLNKENSKSPVRHNKRVSSRSPSRSPASSKKNKYKRTASRSLSKESISSYKNKSRSASKHRSRSRSRKRSVSRSKAIIRKTHSPPIRHRNYRRRSRSITPQSKRKSYSPGRHSVSRQKKSPKEHSSFSKKRSLTPKRKSVTPRRRSRTPDKRSRSSKRRSRSPSYRSSSPKKLSSPSKRSVRSSESPGKRSSSPSPVGNRYLAIEDKDDAVLNNTPRLTARSVIDGANIDFNNVDSYEEERGCKIPTILLHELASHEHNQYVPNIFDNSYNSGYNSGDMDLGSD